MDPYGNNGEGVYLVSGDEGASAEVTKPDRFAAAQDPVILGRTDSDTFLGMESDSFLDMDSFFSDSNQQQGIDQEADDWKQADNYSKEDKATDEHGLNGHADSVDSGIHCRSHGFGDVDAVASSQQVSARSFNHGKDELDCFRNQQHNSITYKSSQGASCSILPEAIGDEDEIQSTFGANVDGQKLESDRRVPRVGMAFSSEEMVYDFYSNYAKQTGFSVRRGKAEYLRSKKAIIKGKYFLCSCQGHKSKEQIEKPTLFKKQDIRTGCEAMIKCMVNDGTWKISKVILEHNHGLKGCLASDLRGAECSPATTSLSTGKTADEIRTVGEHAPASNVCCSDVSHDTKLQPEDTQNLIDQFKNMQIEDPSFFYTMQVQAANFFWRDSRSKVDYEHFGDVLILDTRTRIKYDMICAAFWGLNHHRQRIIFGWAVLVDQTVGSFNWLLQSFLEAMSSRKPRTIITEFSEEIAEALTVALPETRHCLPSWSILNSFSKYLPSLSDRPDVHNLFSECIFHVRTQEEFETKWKCFIGKYKLHEDMRLASLYRMRKKWSQVFTKNVFSAGLLSIHSDEDARAVFGSLSCETMTLSQIALWCGKEAEYMRGEELREDMHCEKNTMNLKSRSPVEKEAERLYTLSIFRMFQDEFMNSLSLAIEEIKSTATFRKFKLTEEGSTKTDIVEFDPSNLTLACSCGKFESLGILCVHSLKVLNSNNIFKIPSRHLLKRWTKSAKDSLPVDTPSAATSGGRVNSFVREFMQKALHVVHKCATKKRERIALESIDLALGQIARAPRTEEIAFLLHCNKRKWSGEHAELDKGKGAPQLAETTKDGCRTQQKLENNPSSNTSTATAKNNKPGSEGSDPQKEEYIHVRAQRSQATNSHSLAETLRREKINVRMKFLRDLVPGCSKVTDKAVMLDEIINFVQSLQRQVEFLSMKLAVVNPRPDFNIEGLLAKDACDAISDATLLHTRAGPSSTLGLSRDMPNPFPPMHLPPHGLIQGDPTGIERPADPLWRAMQNQKTPLAGGFKEPSQLPDPWEDELNNFIQMGFAGSGGSGTAPSGQDAEGPPPPLSHTKVELRCDCI